MTRRQHSAQRGSSCAARRIRKQKHAKAEEHRTNLAVPQPVAPLPAVLVPVRIPSEPMSAPHSAYQKRTTPGGGTTSKPPFRASPCRCTCRHTSPPPGSSSIPHVSTRHRLVNP
eukprot:485073-Rhodomonas_salina.2